MCGLRRRAGIAREEQKGAILNTIVSETMEQSAEMPVDVFQKLSNSRILFISDEIDDELTSDICATLLLKDQECHEEKITLFINSYGGDIRNVLAIYDVMQMIHSPIETVCMGAAHNEAAILLVSGTEGMRFATKNSVICVGQLVNDWMRVHSDLVDAKSSLNQQLEDNKRMMDIFAVASGKDLKQVMSDFDRKVFMTSQEAMKYGLIDKVIKQTKKVAKK